MKPAPDLCGEECPVARTAAIFDGKWTLLIIRDLLTSNKRYHELQKSLKGISPRLLAMRLRMLEEQGFVTRQVFPTNPPTTEYRLTELGRNLRGVIAAMAEFGTRFLTRT